MAHFDKKIGITFFLFAFCTLIIATEKPIVLLISANNVAHFKRTLFMALNQKYHNFRIIYYADGVSKKDSSELQKWINKNDHTHKITLYINAHKKGLLYNYWHAIHNQISDNEIVIPVGADDWLEHIYVLKHVNNVYQNDRVWMTIGRSISYPAMKTNRCKTIEPTTVQANSWRKESLLLPYCPLYSFYARLFKKIKLNDLLFKNRFFPCAVNEAFMYPLLEMAGVHVYFIADILYVHNTLGKNNTLEECLYLKLAFARYIQQQSPYKPLHYLFCDISESDSSLVDIIVFSFNRPLQLYALLESIEKYISGVGTITILYRISSSDFEIGYEIVKKRFKTAHFIRQSVKPNNFKEKTIQLLRESSRYILFSVDDIIVKDNTNLSECINWIEKTNAYGFYLRLGKNITKCYFPQAPINPDRSINPYVEIDNCCIWQFVHGSHDWKYPNTLDMTIYKKNNLISIFEKLSFKTPNMLEGLWYGTSDFSGIGVCSNFSKIVNLPLNVVQDDVFDNPHKIDIAPEKLLSLFLKGFKFDINSVYRINNESAHIDFIPALILRD